jgi:hypothetical protein
VNNVNLIRVTHRRRGHVLFVDIDKIVDISQFQFACIIRLLDHDAGDGDLSGIRVAKDVAWFNEQLIDRGFILLNRSIDPDQSRLMLCNKKHMLMIGRCPTCGRTKINEEYHVTEPLGYVLDKFNIINPGEVENLGSCDEN